MQFIAAALWYKIRMVALKIKLSLLLQSLIIVIICFLQLVFVKTVFDLQPFSRISSYNAYSPRDKVAMVLRKEKLKFC